MADDDGGGGGCGGQRAVARGEMASSSFFESETARNLAELDANKRRVALAVAAEVE
jgi:hypothetical protein